MASGKLSGKSLRENVLNLLKSRRKEVLVGATYGGDTASILSEGAFCVHTDPITGETKEIGSLAIKVVLNDISAGFGEPVAILLTILLPESAEESDVKRIMLDAEEEAEKWNVEIIGGHTEFTDAVNRPIVNAVGIGIKDVNYTPYLPKAGDDVLITKSIALEGSFILAEKYENLLNLSMEEKEELKEYVASTSVREEARIVRISGIKAFMHDVTEGGILGATSELCDVASIGIMLNKSDIPLSNLTQKICNILEVDPYRLISSGSMLIVTPNGRELRQALLQGGVNATFVGKVIDKKGAYIDSEETKQIFAMPDELYRKMGE